MSIEPLCCAALQSNKSPLLKLDIEGITEPQEALLDSGSTGNFIDPQYARSNNIPLIELDSPCPVIGINGKELKDTIHFKYHLIFTTQGHRFSALFYTLPLGNRNIILGMPWLKKANPDINWATLDIVLQQAEEARLANSTPSVCYGLLTISLFKRSSSSSAIS